MIRRDTHVTGPGSPQANDELTHEKLRRVTHIVRDHLMTMRTSYPRCYKHANLGSTDSVKDTSGHK